MMSMPVTGERWRVAGVALLLLIATLAVYAPLRHAGFVEYDDPGYVTNNDWVKTGFTASSWRAAWSETVLGNWHPVTMLSHLADTTLYGLDPRGHHTTNLLLHALNTVVVFLLLRRLFGGLFRPALAAAAFAFHPYAVDSVAWISQRKNLLSSLCWLLSTLAYVRFVRRASPWALLASLGLFALGLLAKPMLVTFPFTLLLLDAWPLRRVEGIGPASWARWGRLLQEKSAFFLITLLSCAATLATQFSDLVAHSPDKPPLWMRSLFILEHYRLYLERFLWPEGMAVLYPQLPMPPQPGSVLLSALVIGGLTAAAVAGMRRAPGVAVGWFWFLGTLFPVSGIVHIGYHSIADRYMYIPLLGLVLALVWGIPEPWQGNRRGRLRMLGVFGLAVVVGWAAVSRSLLPHWSTSETLFRRALAVTERNHVMHYNLGRLFMEREEIDAAIESFEASLAIKPDYGFAHNNLGWALALRGDDAGAIPHFEAALRAEPGNLRARLNLGWSLLRSERHREALRAFETALGAAPDLPEARQGRDLARQGVAGARITLPRSPRPTGTDSDM